MSISAPDDAALQRHQSSPIAIDTARLAPLTRKMLRKLFTQVAAHLWIVLIPRPAVTEKDSSNSIGVRSSPLSAKNKTSKPEESSPEVGI